MSTNKFEVAIQGYTYYTLGLSLINNHYNSLHDYRSAKSSSFTHFAVMVNVEVESTWFWDWDAKLAAKSQVGL